MAEIAALHESVDVAAPPERVWALVTDLPRMASWSPQGVRTFVRGPVGLGTRAFHVNRSGWKVWPTRSEVVRFDPHRDFAFRIRDNGVIWSYALEPTDAGTRVTHRRETPEGILADAEPDQGRGRGRVSPRRPRPRPALPPVSPGTGGAVSAGR